MSGKITNSTELNNQEKLPVNSEKLNFQRLQKPNGGSKPFKP